MEVFILELVLSSKNITLEDLINVTRRGYKVSISKEAYEKIDKEKYLEIVKEKYKLNTNERKEIVELKAILKSTNYLDFKETPYPKEKGKIKGSNTVNWFVNRKNDKNFKLPTISDYIKEDEKKGKK